jgi:hypothetical protein
MMMTRRKRLLFLALIGAALLLLLAWILFALFSKPEPTPVVVEPVIEVVEEVVVEEEIEREPTVTEKASAEEEASRSQSADVISLSKTFVERYGSYSNEADFGNLKDVLTLMSDDFAEETQSFIDRTDAPNEYYGVNTKVITVDVENEDDATAYVIVNTQREEAIGSTQNIEVKYQEIELRYVKESGEWKVDSAQWL